MLLYKLVVHRGVFNMKRLRVGDRVKVVSLWSNHGPGIQIGQIAVVSKIDRNCNPMYEITTQRNELFYVHRSEVILLASSLIIRGKKK